MKWITTLMTEAEEADDGDDVPAPLGSRRPRRV
jgi:hypothetical protein